MDENTVEMEQQQQGSVSDDAALVPVQEGEAEPVSSLEEITQMGQEQAEASASEPPKKEPGWIRQRVDKAVAKAVQETEQRMQAMFHAQLAPLRESMFDRQAEELVASGEFKSKERALEYVKLKAGVPSTEVQQSAEQPRDDQGRFVSQKTDSDAEVMARAKLLAAQANKIKDSKGLDVAALFNTDPDVKAKILSGEWDFYDVAEAMSKPRRRVPSPVRSTNGAAQDSNVARAINNMTDAQFDRLLKNLEEGKVYDMRD